jgi:hypothetical protein
VSPGNGREINIKAIAEFICLLCGFTGELKWDATKPDGQSGNAKTRAEPRNELGSLRRPNSSIAFARQLHGTSKLAKTSGRRAWMLTTAFQAALLRILHVKQCKASA